jgi:hypothetical protein
LKFEIFLTRTYLKIDLSKQFRHASEGWHPELSEMNWIPASAGMTFE